MNHYDAVLGAPDPQERKIALDKFIQFVRESQREADARIAERNHRSLEWANEIAKAIRNQGE